MFGGSCGPFIGPFIGTIRNYVLFLLVFFVSSSCLLRVFSFYVSTSLLELVELVKLLELVELLELVGSVYALS